MTAGPLAPRVRWGLVILVGVLVAGTFGYRYLEGWTLLQSFFSSVLVISTLGLVRAPESPGGQVLTIGLIVTGVGTLFYLLTQIAEKIIETSLGSQQERRMKREIAAMEGHYIICGYGRVGQHAADELSSQKQQFVIVDTDEGVVERARAGGCLGVVGDATEDDILRVVGIERAAGLLITTPSDAANVFITLSARSFNPDLLIIVRASADSAEAKLKKAGADHVIAPETIGGKRMAALAVRPEAADLADSLVGSQEDHGWLDQTTVEAGSSLAGQRIGESRLYKEAGARIIAIRRKNGQTLLNPGTNEYIREGDILISVGVREEIAKLEELTHADTAGGAKE